MMGLVGDSRLLAADGPGTVDFLRQFPWRARGTWWRSVHLRDCYFNFSSQFLYNLKILCIMGFLIFEVPFLIELIDALRLRPSK